MKRVLLFVCVAFVLALPTQPVQAQEWSAKQIEIWQVISKQWESEKAGDLSWLEMLDASFRGWPIGMPMPVDKDAAQRFFAAEAGRDKILAYHLAPVAIVVAEGTGIAHYYYTLLIEHEDGEREMNTGRSTDILTRTKDGWRYVGWVGEERLSVENK